MSERHHILHEMEETRRELSAAEQEIARCEDILTQLEAELRALEARDRQSLAATAEQIFQRHRPSGYEHTLLTLALLQEPLDADQLARLQLLAREYLLTPLAA